MAGQLKQEDAEALGCKSRIAKSSDRFEDSVIHWVAPIFDLSMHISIVRTLARTSALCREIHSPS